MPRIWKDGCRLGDGLELESSTNETEISVDPIPQSLKVAASPEVTTIVFLGNDTLDQPSLFSGFPLPRDPFSREESTYTARDELEARYGSTGTPGE